jgi:hypothetical protein
MLARDAREPRARRGTRSNTAAARPRRRIVAVRSRRSRGDLGRARVRQPSTLTTPSRYGQTWDAEVVERTDPLSPTAQQHTLTARRSRPTSPSGRSASAPRAHRSGLRAAACVGRTLPVALKDRLRSSDEWRWVRRRCANSAGRSATRHCDREQRPYRTAASSARRCCPRSTPTHRRSAPTRAPR